MTRYSRKRQAALRQRDQAMVFVDYEDLNDHLAPHHGSPLFVITELLEALREHLAKRFDLRAGSMQAYADFSALGEDGLAVQKHLQSGAVDPRFVLESPREATVPLQLSLDVAEALFHRPAGTVVLVTAGRRYTPLVRHLRRHGLRVFVVSLSALPAESPADESLSYVNALELLPSELLSRLEPLVREVPTKRTTVPASPPSRPPHANITEPGLLNALHIIEDYFGQYEEVYLTPLLRKLSELMDQERFDPKDLISGLEEAGAVWLEKRPAHPHDYTVLLVDDEHPDVQAIREELEASDAEEHYLSESYDDHIAPELTSQSLETDGQASAEDFDDPTGDGFDEDLESDGLADGY